MNLTRLLRILRKPPSILVFRGWQEARLAFMKFTRGWERLERSIAHWWSSELAEHRAIRQGSLSIIAEDGPATLREAITRGHMDGTETENYGTAVGHREFEVLSVPVPREGEWPWHTDWRWNVTWPQAYFRSYDHYSSRSKPFDVKLPWELSRLGFLLPLVQLAALEPRSVYRNRSLGCPMEQTLLIVSDWEKSNPLGCTIGWHPMETSMRGINLAIVLEMLKALGYNEPKMLIPLLRLISKHGEFLSRTVEYTDVRGNHYAANLVALLLLGLALGDSYPQAPAWVDYAARRIPTEVDTQFLADGVHFEKSIAYHRLVTELFLIALITMDKKELTVPESTRERVHAACKYSAAYMRPDGWAPNVGDNDDGRVLSFLPRHPRDHRALIGLASAFWRDPQLKNEAGAIPPSAVWFLGSQGLSTWEAMSPEPLDGLYHFSEGGAVILRRRDSFLWMDVGEVGLRGRGGHGHNDLLSFELTLRGQPILVDPGSYVYTADPKARDLFRSTAYHNSLCLDEREIAPLRGMWEISNEAQPFDVEVTSDEAQVHIRASHTGYLQLQDPVTHTREVVLDVCAETLECRDHIDCHDLHDVKRYLHFHPTINVAMTEEGALLSSGRDCWSLRWDKRTQGDNVRGWVSSGYGSRQDSEILVMSSSVSEPAELWFVIQPHAKAPA